MPSFDSPECRTRSSRGAGRSPSISSFQISCLEYTTVVRNVAGADVSERADGHRSAAGGSAAVPCGIGKAVEQRHGGGADRRELVHMAAPRSLVGCGEWHPCILVE